ncbi:WXG100 family type VII secretion target [Nocardia otitidiscaviarum]|uniref:WXG100 family type VII secretion target n=1 Tax=Nocardia otitidiscaviarum TaxID=1823 RepID=UPI0018944F7C|nr:WXG100 family type VII secretion target [Nocardia otitidiscaviarum]MBF6178433.1 WXG100 family type VII secretion target [Nocardia otitidiscaviarum]
MRYRRICCLLLPVGDARHARVSDIVAATDSKGAIMQVSAEELRQAATTFDGLVNTINTLPTIESTDGPMGGWTRSAFMQGSQTAPELDRIESVRTAAMKSVANRYTQFASLLRVSADTYTDTDLAAAEWFIALGDFNSGEAGGTSA